MDIRKVRAEIMRDALCKVTRDVGAHEVAVLQAVHGDAAVQVIDEDLGTVIVDDPAEEYSRLASRYGMDRERRQNYVEIAYGRGPAQLAAALKYAEAKKGSARESSKESVKSVL